MRLSVDSIVAFFAEGEGGITYRSYRKNKRPHLKKDAGDNHENTLGFRFL
jgi:hypothetical protein